MMNWDGGENHEKLITQMQENKNPKNYVIVFKVALGFELN